MGTISTTISAILSTVPTGKERILREYDLYKLYFSTISRIKNRNVIPVSSRLIRFKMKMFSFRKIIFFISPPIYSAQSAVLSCNCCRALLWSSVTILKTINMAMKRCICLFSNYPYMFLPTGNKLPNDFYHSLNKKSQKF